MLTNSTNLTHHHRLGAIRPQLEAELARVLDFWAKRVIVPGGGRICGRICLNAQADDTADVASVYLSRVLWTFSTATQFLGTENYRPIADAAFAQLRNDFVDPVHGGVYWSTDAQGNTIVDKKQGYAQAFALYALSAYARMSADPAAASLCHNLFYLIENRFADREHGGYWEAWGRDWSEPDDARLSERDHQAAKSMNTHLHIMEAYSEYFRTFRTPEARQALRGLIELFERRICLPDRRHLRMFWTHDWEDLSTTVSYGHDIEASWLLAEAGEFALQETEFERLEPLVLGLVDACKAEGLGPLGEILHEADEELPVRVWWCQAEGLVGFINAFQLRGSEEDASHALKVWDFIMNHVVDAPSGEWRWFSAIDDAGECPYIGGEWKACYHNGRALIEALTRIEKLDGI